MGETWGRRHRQPPPNRGRAPPLRPPSYRSRPLVLFGTFLGLFVGLALGLLGGGGSVLTVPIFVYVLGLEVRVAVAGSLAIVGATAAVGAVRQRRQGHVRFRVAVGFGVFAMAGSFAGARIATRIPETVQLLLFAVVMLAAAIFMLKGRPEPEPGEDHTEARGVLATAPAALAVGVLTGLVGVGGGFLIVPALALLLHLPIKDAIGTSLVVIVMNATSGFAGYLGAVEVPWALLGGFGGMSILGVSVGTRLMRDASPEGLRKGFAIFLVVIAVAILAENAIRLA